MSGHTPGPLPSALVVGEGVPNGTLVLGYELNLKDKGTAKLFALGSFPSEARDVVMEIRNRWNAHADLVAACEALIACESAGGVARTRKGLRACDYCTETPCAPTCPVGLARAAIAKAGGA